MNNLGKQICRCIVSACDDTCKYYDAEKACCVGYGEVADQAENVFAEYENYKNLEEQGKLLKLPCAIGDTVYWLCETEILQMEIEYFQILPNKIKFSFKYCGDGRLENFTKYMYDNDIGKDVFLTRGEAEAALKEL